MLALYHMQNPPRYSPNMRDKIWAGRSGDRASDEPSIYKVMQDTASDKTIPLPISWLLWTKHLNSADGCKWVHFLKQSCKKNKSHDLIQFKIAHTAMCDDVMSHDLHIVT